LVGDTGELEHGYALTVGNSAGSELKKIKTSSVYDCTVEDVENI